jgi:hypothetical protein
LEEAAANPVPRNKRPLPLSPHIKQRRQPPINNISSRHLLNQPPLAIPNSHIHHRPHQPFLPPNRTQEGDRALGQPAEEEEGQVELAKANNNSMRPAMVAVVGPQLWQQQVLRLRLLPACR